ncbi:hypothetical protein [Arcobacter vandammei]|uniref:hypothetical protein n=1 Tax=Arcobacter vandammei TaxID=2782243 RepID=UPI0018DF64E3|nr:hypothetical protein [Arcobacter vandammei]
MEKKDDLSSNLYKIFEKYYSKKLMANVDTKIIKYNIENQEIITTITDDIKKNCYVVSMYNLIIDYSKDELLKINSKILLYFSYFLIKIFENILKIAKIDKLQILNNYMLSTNFFSNNFENIDLKVLKNKALKNYPDHTLKIRSVNKFQNLKLYEKLKKDGWIALVSRQVYIFDDFTECKKHKDYKSDKKLLLDEKYEFKALNIEDFSLFQQAENLYNQLYLDKYSKHNVQFKAIYLQELVKNGLLHLRLLFDKKEKKYVAVVGIIGENGLITAPIVGYDLNYDIKEALYRRVIAYILEYAITNNYLLNLSSGASNFKTNRGAKAYLEYMFVYTKHLPFYRRFIWKILSFIANRFYGNLLQRLKL